MARKNTNLKRNYETPGTPSWRNIGSEYDDPHLKGDQGGGRDPFTDLDLVRHGDEAREEAELWSGQEQLGRVVTGQVLGSDVEPPEYTPAEVLDLRRRTGVKLPRYDEHGNPKV